MVKRLWARNSERAKHTAFPLFCDIWLLSIYLEDFEVSFSCQTLHFYYSLLGGGVCVGERTNGQTDCSLARAGRLDRSTARSAHSNQDDLTFFWQDSNSWVLAAAQRAQATSHNIGTDHHLSYCARQPPETENKRKAYTPTNTSQE